jgi:SM-20-related protein
MLDTLLLPDFLSAPEARALLLGLRRCEGESAPVYGRGDGGGSVDLRTRATTRLKVGDATRARVAAALERSRSALEAHFGLALVQCEPPQFLRYETGGFFVAHQDGNTPLLHDDTRFRRLSVVLFLSPPAATAGAQGYGGGELVLHGPLRGPAIREAYTPAPGTLLAFRAETTHEVTPLTSGERYTVVAWWR